MNVIIDGKSVILVPDALSSQPGFKVEEFLQQDEVVESPAPEFNNEQEPNESICANEGHAEGESIGIGADEFPTTQDKDEAKQPVVRERRSTRSLFSGVRSIGERKSCRPLFSGYNWPKAAIEVLLSLKRDFADHFERPTCKKKKIWCQIAEKMKREGYAVTGEECNMKWRNLVTTYNNNKAKARKYPSKITWEFYYMMDELMPPSKGDTNYSSAAYLPRSNRAANDNSSSEYSSQSSSGESGGRRKRRSKHRHKKTKSNKHDDKPPTWFVKFCRTMDGKDKARDDRETKCSDEEPVEADVAAGPSNKRSKAREMRYDSNKADDDAPPLWFVNFCEERDMKETEKEEEQKKQWDEQKMIELEKLEAFRRLTATIIEKLK